uniref:Uncharacterized protein n=1 Tax=Sphaerodactylus townsendi TaxID=933632 RepID=A0ACB8EX31_9SAUR
MECVIRPAASEDCDHIMALIREIAEFHHLLDEVTINSQVLKADGFGEDPFFKCILAELPAETGKPGKGIGTKLLGQVAEAACLAAGCVEMHALMTMWTGTPRPKGFYSSTWGAQDLTQSEERHCMELDRECLAKAGPEGKAQQQGCRLGPSSAKLQL